MDTRDRPPIPHHLQIKRTTRVWNTRSQGPGPEGPNVCVGRKLRTYRVVVIGHFMSPPPARPVG